MPSSRGAIIFFYEYTYTSVEPKARRRLTSHIGTNSTHEIVD